MNAMTDFPPLETADNTIDFAALAKQPPLPAVLQDIADISNGKAVVKLNATEAGLAALRADLSGKRYDLTTTKGDKDARADRQRCVTLRTTLEKRRKEMKAPALEFGRLIDAEASRITKAIEALEAPIDAAIKADEQRRADEKAERERTEAERIAGLKGQVDALMRGWLDRCNEPDMTAERVGKGIEKFASLQAPADLADVADYWSAQQSITTGRMQTIRADLERAEESARLAAERAELERQRAEQDAERNRIAGVNSRIEEIRAAATGHDNASSATLGEAITAVQALAITEAVYGEFALVAMDAKIQTLASLVRQQKAAQEREAQEHQALVDAQMRTLDQAEDAAIVALEQAQAGVAENPRQQQPAVPSGDAAADGGAGAEVVAAADDAPAAPASFVHRTGYIRFGGVDPKFCPGSNPEAPQEFPEQRFPNEAPAFDLTPDATDLLGDAATPATQTTEQAARALLDHIAEAFTGRFPSDPKPGRQWFIDLKALASNLNDTI